jgi:hypothetical protein
VKPPGVALVKLVSVLVVAIVLLLLVLPFLCRIVLRRGREDVHEDLEADWSAVTTIFVFGLPVLRILLLPVFGAIDAVFFARK